MYDPVAFRDDALYQPDPRPLRALLYLGLTDAYRCFTASRTNTPSGTTRPAAGTATRACGSTICCCRRRRRPDAACDIDKSPRGKDRASDHTPIWCELAV
jgi:exodeoxyribonuclease-3